MQTLDLQNARSLAKMRWQYRAVEALRGNQQAMGAVMIAVLGKAAMHRPPRSGHQAMINAQGIVIAPYENRHGAVGLARVATVQELRGEFNKLADKLHFTDTERNEMFGELRKWIAFDERAESDRTLI